MSNKNLMAAKRNKNDEFYTLYEDVASECSHYIEHFENKIIYMNCDNPKYSNFWKYFKDNFHTLKLKKIISTYYIENEQTYKTEFDGITETKTLLNGNGDFRSDECIEILKESDLVITNPPFSLWRMFLSQLMEYNKKFLIIGNLNAVSCKYVFECMKENKVYITSRRIRFFKQPDGSITKLGNGCWYSNLKSDERIQPLNLYKKYTPEEYPVYDDYNAINCNKTKDIPCDYDGLIGVPVSFIEKYNPSQFELIDLLSRYSIFDLQGTNEKIRNKRTHATCINGKALYSRLIIKPIKH